MNGYDGRNLSGYGDRQRERHADMLKDDLFIEEMTRGARRWFAYGYVFASAVAAMLAWIMWWLVGS